MDFSSNRNVTSLRLGKTVMEKEYAGFESNVSCSWRDVEGVCVCCPLSTSTSAVIWSVMVLEGEENVLDVRYIQQDGVVFLTLSIIKATHVSPVWLGMRGGSTAECYMNSVLDKKNSTFLTKLNISNPLNTM